MGDEPFPDDLGDGMLTREEKVRIIAEIVRFPADFDGEVSEGLTEESGIKPSIPLALVVPFFCLGTYPHQLLFVLLLEGEFLEIVVLGCEKLSQRSDTIVFQDVAQVRNVVSHANLLDFIHVFSISEAYHEGSYSKVLTILYINSLFRNIHPSTILACKIHHVEVFEAVELKLCVLR